MARTYTEAEIAALLARAAERQRTSPEAPHGPTLTLDEIERIAVEAGLDPAHLRAAAADLDRGALRDPAKPGTVLLERWVDVPFSDVGWEEVVGTLRAEYGLNMATYSLAGTPSIADTSRVGAGHEWRHINSSYMTTTTVTVSSRGDRTRVRVGVHDGMGNGKDRTVAGLWAAMAAFLPAILIGIGTGEWANHKGVGLFTVFVAFAILTVVGAFAGAGAVRRARDRKAQRAADTLETVARCLEEAAGAEGTVRTAASAAVPAGPTPAADAVGRRVDFDAVVGDAADAGGETPRERRRESS